MVRIYDETRRHETHGDVIQVVDELNLNQRGQNGSSVSEP